jgi:hypothetical protein
MKTLIAVKSFYLIQMFLDCKIVMDKRLQRIAGGIYGFKEVLLLNLLFQIRFSNLLE